MAAKLDPLLAARVGAVADDHLSGAATLTHVAIEILIDAHRAGGDVVDAVACALCAAQPAMASVWNAAAVAVGADGLQRLQRLDRQVQRAPRILARVLTDVLRPRREGPGAVSRPIIVATVSASATVRVCLEALSERTRVEVICTEARPLMEGRQMATDLIAAGIPTTVCTDVGVGAVMAAVGPQLEAVVVGTDAVAPRWFVNKCGTRHVVEVAAGFGVPSYVVGSRDKFIGETLAVELRPNEGAPQEVWEHPPAGVTVANPYFERVPVELAAMFVTDAGPLGPASVSELCQSVVNPADSARLVGIIRLARGG